ncbi:MAG TPA: outer membrane protein assembly factor BamA [Candidatus Hydrogenedentes bacterium]|nr:outer membrane protein assembly factor BamA [Candidatus Hydrogenedentota bacterium]HIJ74828.1 outer membrane protein assembly factor BamA [Candidatus Hydrogenedentota bacterium]
MRQRAVPLALAVVGAVCAAAHAQDLADRTVREVRLDGLERVNEQRVRSHLEVKPGQKYSPPAIARDIRRLYGLGFFVTIQADVSLEEDQLIVTYLLSEKRVIDEIKVIGNKKISSRQIRSVLSWQRGDSFVEDAYDEERQAVLDLYADKGFQNASVDILVEETGPSRVRITFAIEEGKKARIRSIRFTGNEILSQRKLRKLMKTKRAKWFLGGKFDEATFDADLENVVDEYGNYGRLEAAVPDTEFEYVKKGKRLDITIRVDEGPEYHVESLAIANNEVFDDDELLNAIKVHEDDVHNVGQIQKDAETIEKGYQDSGYVLARVTARPTIDREKKTTHVVHDVYEDELKYVREIEITGNTSTKDEVLRRRLFLIPGDRYDGAMVQMSLRTLEDTRYFEETRITMDPVEEDDRFINLLLDVDEGKTGNLSFGAGYSTEEKFGGFIELERTNFDILNWPTFTGGGQRFRAKLALGDVRSEYYLSFMDDEIFGYPLGAGLDIFDESYDYTGGIDFSQRSQGVQLRFGKMLSPYLNARSVFRYSEDDITDLPFLFGGSRYRRHRGGDTTISSAWGLTRNTLDFNRDPSTGAKHDAEIEIAGLGGDNHFIKLQQDSTWYWPLGGKKRWVLSVRARLGWVDEYGSSDYVPITERFFAGGSSTVRGYDTRDIGPKERRFIWWGEKSAIGGEFRSVNNIEVKYKLTNQFRLYAFYDNGGVWETIGDFDLSNYKHSVGLGLGVDVPVMGPVRIDYGFPINPDSDQGSGRLHFNVRF